MSVPLPFFDVPWHQVRKTKKDVEELQTVVELLTQQLSVLVGVPAKIEHIESLLSSLQSLTAMLASKTAAIESLHTLIGGPVSKSVFTTFEGQPEPIVTEVDGRWNLSSEVLHPTQYTRVFAPRNGSYRWTSDYAIPFKLSANKSYAAGTTNYLVGTRGLLFREPGVFRVAMKGLLSGFLSSVDTVPLSNAAAFWSELVRVVLPGVANDSDAQVPPENLKPAFGNGTRHFISSPEIIDSFSAPFAATSREDTRCLVIPQSGGLCTSLDGTNFLEFSTTDTGTAGPSGVCYWGLITYFYFPRLAINSITGNEESYVSARTLQSHFIPEVAVEIQKTSVQPGANVAFQRPGLVVNLGSVLD